MNNKAPLPQPREPRPQQLYQTGPMPALVAEKARLMARTRQHFRPEPTGPLRHQQGPAPTGQIRRQRGRGREPVMPGQTGHSGMPASGAPPVHPAQRQQRESAIPNSPVSRETNYKKCTVRTIDGTTIHGKVNISGVSRLSDLFANEAATFIVMVEVRMGGGNGKTIFVNKDHIVWVEPLDDNPGA